MFMFQSASENPLFASEHSISLNFLDPSAKKGTPSIIIVDLRKPSSRQPELDKYGKFFVKVPVRGNVGVFRMVDRHLSFALESAASADKLVALLQQLEQTDSRRESFEEQRHQTSATQRGGARRGSLDCGLDESRLMENLKELEIRSRGGKRLSI
mmetsp:Transcript_79299/g.212657  ORF Transcript_79299/g.212657 Transcript_79299/m.212657 type:complete len:155 (+) Transcript_79299:241-705(+)